MLAIIISALKISLLIHWFLHCTLSLMTSLGFIAWGSIFPSIDAFTKPPHGGLALLISIPFIEIDSFDPLFSITSIVELFLISSPMHEKGGTASHLGGIMFFRSK